ncbi:MAG TPA: flagellar basal-body MS-ring/collar protein FliF [Candidatus Paceibacterota bacterium]|nr:flagellar basal-body MS-ring/collar protein FliF [Candidatus Paceibacterota bacterium]
MVLSPLATDTLNAVRSRTASVLSGFTAGQKVMTGLSVIGLVIAGVAFMRIESQPNFQPLFTNLRASDAGAVTTALTAANVPYKLSSGGTTVLVPAQLVDQERVTLAEQGLPSSGTVGFSNLAKSGITTSQFVQQVEYQQALEEQLQQTIESIQGIASARVILVIPAQSSFAIGDQPTPTASILVNLLPGATLTSGQVTAIVHLAASATPGLSASDVTVVDNHGDVLSTMGDTSGGTGSSESAQTIAYNNQLAKAIEALLNRVVGAGNAVVQVHALLNFDQQSTTTVGFQVDAEGKPIVVPTGQTTSSQTYTGTGAPPSGVLGSGTPPVATSSSGNYTSTSSQVTNAVGQVTQTVKQAPGQVVKTSIAVLLNSAAKTKISQAAVTSLVTAAAGLDTTSGDQVAVTVTRFASTNLTSPATTGSRSRLPLEHAAEVVVLALLIMAMMFFALRAARRPRYDEIQVPGFTQTGPRVLAREDAPRPVIELPVIAGPPGMEVASDVALSQVSSYIEARPAEVARLLRTWAAEQHTEPV